MRLLDNKIIGPDVRMRWVAEDDWLMGIIGDMDNLFRCPFKDE